MVGRCIGQSESHSQAGSYADRLQYIAMEEGRARYNEDSTLIVYDYFIKDHLGNVRMVLTDEKDTSFYPAATMEPSNSTVENTFYSNIEISRNDHPQTYSDPYTNPNEYVSTLIAGNNDELVIGPAIALRVMAGDKFNLRVGSWWSQDPPQGNPVNPLPVLLSALNSSIGGVAGNHGGPGSYELELSNVLEEGAENFLNSQSYNSSRPKAFINWILFDDRFKYVSTGSGFEQVGPDNTFTVHNFTNQAIPKNGYLFIYVSNSSDEIKVYFDNLQVTHIRGPLVEETHYYPFGLILNGISSKSFNIFPINKNKFNDGTELQNNEFTNGDGIDLYATTFRSFDPQLGRFWQIDPLAESTGNWSPYTFCQNNTILYNDPLGLDTTINGIDLTDSEYQYSVTVSSKYEAPPEFRKYIPRINGLLPKVASFNDWPLSFSNDRTNDLVDSWALGLGANYRLYLSQHPMTKKLKDAWQVKRAILYFYKKYLKNIQSGCTLKGASVTDFRGRFGLRGLINAGGDIVEQFVGSMSINIYVDDKGENLMFVVSNNTSKTSATYHLMDSHERSTGNEAMGNFYQTYIWKEPLKNNTFLKAAVGMISEF